MANYGAVQRQVNSQIKNDELGMVKIWFILRKYENQWKIELFNNDDHY